jgi:hypothetical protein
MQRPERPWRVLAATRLLRRVCSAWCLHADWADSTRLDADWLILRICRRSRYRARRRSEVPWAVLGDYAQLGYCVLGPAALDLPSYVRCRADVLSAFARNSNLLTSGFTSYSSGCEPKILPSNAKSDHDHEAARRPPRKRQLLSLGVQHADDARPQGSHRAR